MGLRMLFLALFPNYLIEPYFKFYSFWSFFDFFYLFWRRNFLHIDFTFAFVSTPPTVDGQKEISTSFALQIFSLTWRELYNKTPTKATEMNKLVIPNCRLKGLPHLGHTKSFPFPEPRPFLPLECHPWVEMWRILQNGESEVLGSLSWDEYTFRDLKTDWNGREIIWPV